MSLDLRRQDGANAVEFALVLPILIVLIFGIFYGGIAFNRQLALTQAAREGARFGATLPFEGSAPDPAWFEAVIDRVEDGATGALSSADATVCVRFVNASNEATGADCGVDAEQVDDRARVEVAVERPAVLDFILYAYPVTLRAEAISRFEPDVEAGGP